MGGFLLQRRQVGRQLSVVRNALQTRKIPERFVHYKDDIGRPHRRGGAKLRPERRIRAGGSPDLLCHRPYRVLAVIFRFFYVQHLQICEKARDDAVIFVVSILHPHIRNDAQRKRHTGALARARQYKAEQCARYRRNRAAPAPARSMGIRQTQKAAACQHHGEDDSRKYHRERRRKRYAASHARKIADLRKIPRQKRLAPHFQLQARDHARKIADHACDERCQPVQPEKAAEQHIQQYKQYPAQQKAPEMRQKAILPKIGIQRIAVDPFRCGKKHGRRQHRPDDIQPERGAQPCNGSRQRALLPFFHLVNIPCFSFPGAGRRKSFPYRAPAGAPLSWGAALYSACARNITPKSGFLFHPKPFFCVSFYLGPGAHQQHILTDLFNFLPWDRNILVSAQQAEQLQTTV